MNTEHDYVRSSTRVKSDVTQTTVRLSPKALAELLVEQNLDHAEVGVYLSFGEDGVKEIIVRIDEPRGSDNGAA